MAGMGRPIAGDGLSANVAGMSKTQLYDIVSQMKSLIEQNQQQARQILIQNPPLTKALFQAQIMLGMVQPPQPVQNIQPPPAQQSTLQTNVQAPQSLSGQVGMKDQTGGAPPRMQHPNQPPPMATSTSIPGLNTHSQPTPLHPVQPQKGHLNVQVTPPVSISQSSHHASMQQPLQVHPSQQLQQQPLQTPAIPHMPLQPPLPPQPRPPTYQHQYPPHNAGFQQAGAPHHIQQLPPYHAGNKPPHMGPSFPPAQHLPNQPPPPVYQPAPMGNEFNNQVSSSMQVDRGSSWMPAPPENPTLTQHGAPPPLVPSQMGPSNPTARPQSLTPEMEKALLQQVMSLTPDQINLLPPEQRNQVLQLQQILRQ